MSCQQKLLEQLDRAAEDFRFPLWSCDTHYAVVGAMRISGFTASSGVALMFERFEHTIGENVIQCMTFCMATFPISTWLHSGGSIQFIVPYSKDGKRLLDFGTLDITSRGQTFTIALDKEQLIADGYLDSQAQQLTPEAVLLKICDTVPRDWLFCEPGYVQHVFSMPDDIHRLFVIEAWQHPSFESLYGDEQVRPSNWPDFVAMAEALCTGNASPTLPSPTNTSWREQCRNTNS